ncbi:alpha/beta fold hydrolase [Ramlibacter sp. Leaf400]|uniref:alpha/beta fold hydrolase n=1 Tax=Ramlibacter sp. Leaf400 TaxID=1736365 RepID=UPI0006FBD5C9|nr:alpha/beta hydrolase [Ramlibacter sp. Leaf400]KQT08114.1 hydrolase [Ramlibacter sp. Leaf400]
MATPRPFVREAGQGPTVLCVHSNASHSGQWRELMEQLSDRFHVVAVDSWGSGRTAEWPSDRVIRLDDEVDLVEPLLLEGAAPVHLVGHSYGGAVALKAALRHRERIGRVALYEPTLFALVERETPADVEGIRGAVQAAAAALDHGDADAAGQAFIDFWMGEGSWARIAPERRKPMAESCRNVRRWAHALMTDPVTPEDVRGLDRPVLLMTGERSPLSSLSVARRLQQLLARAQHVQLPKLGHMGPVTHPAVVNAGIAKFLDGGERPD